MSLEELLEQFAKFEMNSLWIKIWSCGSGRGEDDVANQLKPAVLRMIFVTHSIQKWCKKTKEMGRWH